MKRYVHGFKGHRECYGHDTYFDNFSTADSVEPCTYKEALSRLRKLPKDERIYYRIYKLVEVKPKKRKRR